MKEICIIYGDDEAPTPPPAMAEPKGKSKEHIDIAVGDIITRQSSRLKNIAAHSKNTTTPSAPDVGRSNLPSIQNYKAGASHALSTQDIVLEGAEELTARFLRTVELLTYTQLEATEQIITILDREADSRLWTSEEGRLRCWLDIAEKFVVREAVTHAYETVEMDESEDEGGVLDVPN